ncbi:MAG: T9SS type A sorting domain-containing protein [Bacteroidales bacterium]|nr:T9SS type A sorting domain-containing protein [Bacteroidales bacterium]MDT8431008.1 T9SS type A sorting domain-containing protein [Bacteroidales bacterium]
MIKRTFFKLIALFSCVLIYGQREEYTWDIVTFEEPYRYLEIDTIASNTWETGSPDKMHLNGSYAGMNSIATRLYGAYPTDNHSAFTLKISGMNVDHYPYSVYLEFMHRLDTEAGKDGGYIDVSYDGGQTWTNIIEDRSGCYVPGDDFETEGLYSLSDTLYNGEYGFSGEVHDWSKVRFGWEGCMVKSSSIASDSMLLRFHFISDGHDTSQEGWNIDHIRLFSMPITGSTADGQANGFSVLPNPAVDEILIVSVDGSVIERIWIYDMTGKFLGIVEGTNRISVAEYPAGIYFLEIESGNREIFKKVMKQ